MIPVWHLDNRECISGAHGTDIYHGILEIPGRVIPEALDSNADILPPQF
jgi:hypothetical protein